MPTKLPDAVQLRPATEADAPAIASLLSATGLPAPDAVRRGGMTVVAHLGAELVGTATLELHETDALLRSVCVDARWRSRGVGSALTERALTDAALEAVDAVFLITLGAERFFARFGFRDVVRDRLPVPIARALVQSAHAPAGARLMQLRLAES